MDAGKDLELFSRIAEGDTKAFKSIFICYKGELYFAANKLVKDASLAEEIVQETFIRLWIHRAGLSSIRHPKSYLYRILLNYSTDVLRSENTRNRIMNQMAVTPQTRSNTTTQDMLSFSETERRLTEGLRLLSPQQRTAYELIEQNGLSFEEAATQMNISVNTLKSHLQRAREFIRNYLSDIALITLLLTSWK